MLDNWHTTDIQLEYKRKLLQTKEQSPFRYKKHTDHPIDRPEKKLSVI